MKVITAPESIDSIFESRCCFLAGGITNCKEWQKDVIELLSKYDGILFNPRRNNFPINDQGAARTQILWEFNALERADVFSMWFSNAPSDQPICFYELGRHLALRKAFGELNSVVIGVEPGFKRTQDVLIQTELVSPKLAARISNNLEDHAKNILSAMRSAE